MALSLVLRAVAVDFAWQTLGFVPSALLRTERFYDMFGTSTFPLVNLVCVYLAGGFYSSRQVAVTMAVTVWALRLFKFLVARVHGKADRRFNGVRDAPAVFAVYWAIQGVWVAASLSSVMLMHAFASGARTDWTTLDFGGAAVFLTGFAVEHVADSQKRDFRALAGNEERFINVGLWSISRHPNYFGEIVVWIGIWLLCASGLPFAYAAFGVLSPAFVAFLLIRVSGIPILERHAKRKWGDDPSYRDYVASTAKLIPWLW